MHFEHRAIYTFKRASQPFVANMTTPSRPSDSAMLTDTLHVDAYVSSFVNAAAFSYSQTGITSPIARSISRMFNTSVPANTAFPVRVKYDIVVDRMRPTLDRPMFTVVFVRIVAVSTGDTAAAPGVIPPVTVDDALCAGYFADTMGEATKRYFWKELRHEMRVLQEDGGHAAVGGELVPFYASVAQIFVESTTLPADAFM